MISCRSQVPELRVRRLNDELVRANGEYVLYWMIANRRCSSNYSLQRAADWARTLQRPLLILEALRVDYPWASDRLHRFVLQGMADNQAALQHVAAYYPYLEREPGEGRGLMAALAARACLVVTDDFPCFFLPRMLRAVARRLDVQLEAVDSNGLLPLRAANQVFPLAHSFRRFLHKALPPHLAQFPLPNPLAEAPLPLLGELPVAITQRWAPVAVVNLHRHAEWVAELPLDHSVGLSPLVGGHLAAQRRLRQFVDQQLDQYGELRNHPDDDASSGLSPYLHFGHIGAHQVFQEVMSHDSWQIRQLSTQPTGSREGWWGASPSVESFLDEFVTWRELGYNLSWQSDQYDKYESLPDWARLTLNEHARDPRPTVYGLPELAAAETHDELWNAAQRQLLREGRMHNYLRMLWGKKILEWSASPQQALAHLIELNNRYALDGRNPNSYSGIFWVLGRYDRAWGPERPIFGKIRYMSSENTARKLRIRRYLAIYNQQTP